VNLNQKIISDFVYLVELKKNFFQCNGKERNFVNLLPNVVRKDEKSIRRLKPHRVDSIFFESCAVCMEPQVLYHDFVTVIVFNERRGGAFLGFDQNKTVNYQNVV
jgi:hypothetical protein